MRRIMGEGVGTSVVALCKRKRAGLFPRATSQVAMLARIFGDCREGLLPRSLLRGKFDAALLAAG